MSVSLTWAWVLMRSVIDLATRLTLVDDCFFFIVAMIMLLFLFIAKILRRSRCFVMARHTRGWLNVVSPEWRETCWLSHENRSISFRSSRGLLLFISWAKFRSSASSSTVTSSCPRRSYFSENNTHARFSAPLTTKKFNIRSFLDLVLIFLRSFRYPFFTTSPSRCPAMRSLFVRKIRFCIRRCCVALE